MADNTGRTDWTEGASGAGVTGASRARTALAAGALVGVGYVLVAALSTRIVPTELVDPTQVVYPLSWFVVSAAAVTAARPGARQLAQAPHYLAAGVAYAGLLAWGGGLIQVGSAGIGLDVVPAIPGWGPLVVIEAGIVTATVVPFRAVGYLVAGYLFARGLAASRASLAAGLVGTFACVGCLPLLLAGAAGLGVAASGVIGTPWVGTLAFAATLFALVYVINRNARPACSVGTREP